MAMISIIDGGKQSFENYLYFLLILSLVLNSLIAKTKSIFYETNFLN